MQDVNRVYFPLVTLHRIRHFKTFRGSQFSRQVLLKCRQQIRSGINTFKYVFQYLFMYDELSKTL